MELVEGQGLDARQECGCVRFDVGVGAPFCPIVNGPVILSPSSIAVMGPGQSSCSSHWHAAAASCLVYQTEFCFLSEGLFQVRRALFSGGVVLVAPGGSRPSGSNSMPVSSSLVGHTPGGGVSVTLELPQTL